MAEGVTVKAFQRALIHEFAAAVEAVLGGVTTTPVPQPADGDGWQLAATAAGDLDGAIVAWIDRAGSELLAQRVMGMDEAPDAATVADMLREMWAQAAGALSLKEPFTGIKLVLAAPEAAPAPATSVVCDLATSDLTARIAVGGNAVAAERAMPAPIAKPALVTPPAEKLDIVLDMELPLVVRFGRTIMSLRALSALGPGSIVDMERSPDEPVQMLVGDQVIARGEVVVVGGNYGVRITDLVSPAERARVMEV
ncbi:MAG: FliM/FliN family flagellar motor switch protein [Vicinamibacterales bacterium]